MARPLCIEFAGALYHITARGNERRDIFFSTHDREVFLRTLASTCERFNWLCPSYCQMTNHYHLLLETLDANLSKGMRQLNGVYTQYVNRTHTRVGHLFQGRFKGIMVEKEAYLLELARYIVLNPVRAGIVSRPEDWPWISYRAMIGVAEKASFLTTDWVLGAFSDNRRKAVSAYQQFVVAGEHADSPWHELKNQIYLGSDRFVEQLQARIRPDRPLEEIPLTQRRPVAKSLRYYAQQYHPRDLAIAEAHRSGAYSMQQIGIYFGVGRMTVSRAVKKHEFSPAEKDGKWET